MSQNWLLEVAIKEDVPKLRQVFGILSFKQSISPDVHKVKTTTISKMLEKRTKCHWATSSLEKSVYWLLYLKVEMRKKHRDSDKILLSWKKTRGIKTKVEKSI